MRVFSRIGEKNLLQIALQTVNLGEPSIIYTNFDDFR